MYTPLVLDALNPFDGLLRRPGFTAGDALSRPFLAREDVLADRSLGPRWIDIDVMDTDALSLAVGGQVIEEARAPAVRGDCTPAAENGACAGPRYTGHIRVAALDDRVQFSSTYHSPDRIDDPARHDIDDALGIRSAAARPTLRERIDFAPVDLGSLRISSYGEYAAYGPLSDASDAFGGGRSKTRFGADVGIDPLKVGFNGTIFAPGAEYLGTELATRERDIEVHAELQLASLLGGGGPLPSRITVSRSLSRIDPFDFEADDGVDSTVGMARGRTVTDALTPSWDWSRGTTRLSFSQTSYRSTIDGETTDSSLGHAVDLRHSVKFGTGQASASFGYAATEHPEPFTAVEEAYRAAAALSCGIAGLPDLDARAQWSLARTTSVNDGSASDVHWTISSGLDFSKFLAEPLIERAGSLKLSGTLYDTDATAAANAAPVGGMVALTGKIGF